MAGLPAGILAEQVEILQVLVNHRVAVPSRPELVLASRRLGRVQQIQAAVDKLEAAVAVGPPVVGPAAGPTAVVVAPAVAAGGGLVVVEAEAAAVVAWPCQCFGLSGLGVTGFVAVVVVVAGLLEGRLRLERLWIELQIGQQTVETVRRQIEQLHVVA